MTITSKYTWTFIAEGGRKATVKAYTEDDAYRRAVALLDYRIIKSGSEPLVGWGLALLHKSLICSSKRKIP